MSHLLKPKSSVFIVQRCARAVTKSPPAARVPFLGSLRERVEQTTSRNHHGWTENNTFEPARSRPVTTWRVRSMASQATNNGGAAENKNGAPETRQNASHDASAAPEEETVSSEPTESAEEPVPESETVLSREEELRAQIKDVTDKLLRSLAEQQNTRQIATRDIDSARQFAIKSFASSLLDVADNLHRALASVPKEELNNETNSVLVNLYQGIELTNQGLQKAFAANGLSVFGQVGERFDPNQHAALYEYVDPKQTPGTIGQVIKPGYLLNKRVLRPAQVGVIKKGD